MSTTYTPVANITEAQPGDELMQAGEWVAIEWVIPFRRNVQVVFVGGGSHTAPAHHFGKVRRPVAAGKSPGTAGAAIANEVASWTEEELDAKLNPTGCYACDWNLRTHQHTCK